MENFNKELAFVKTNLIKILDLKNIIAAIKKLVNRLNSELDTAKEDIDGEDKASRKCLNRSIVLKKDNFKCTI